VSRASRLVQPGLVVPLVPEAEIDLGSGPSIPGLPDGEPGNGGGSCLFGCDGHVGAAVPAAEPASPDPPHSRSFLRVGGSVREPRKVRHVAPAYPPLAVAARVQGSVTLECVIGEDGRVSEIVVVRGHPLLDEAAADAVRQWRYTPTLLNGVRVSVILTVVVAFRLR
jgi:protein TonB